MAGSPSKSKLTPLAMQRTPNFKMQKTGVGSGFCLCK
jgi:hypothetical protein